VGRVSGTHRLYLAPKHHSYGLTWGYSGTGPSVLARLIHKMLDDTTTDLPDPLRGAPPGLRKLTALDWPAGTVLTRALLEAARDDRPYDYPNPPSP
jgi:hypothetical protein